MRRSRIVRERFFHLKGFWSFWLCILISLMGEFSCCDITFLFPQVNISIELLSSNYRQVHWQIISFHILQQFWHFLGNFRVTQLLPVKYRMFWLRSWSTNNDSVTVWQCDSVTHHITKIKLKPCYPIILNVIMIFLIESHFNI